MRGLIFFTLLASLGLIWTVSAGEPNRINSLNRRRPRPPQMQLRQNAFLGNENIDFQQARGLQPIASPSAQIHAPFEPPVTAEKIKTAIADAAFYLRSQQQPDGSIESGYVQGGSTALATLALLASGAHPTSDPAAAKALEWLLKLETDNTYVVGIRANVWEYALRKAPYEARFREALKRDFDWLLEARNEEGWRYSKTSSDWDNSCTQYGVLGLWAGARAGLKVDDAVWAALWRHFKAHQNKDGGWGYVHSSGSSANMATAGLASLFLIFDMRHSQSVYSRSAPNPFTEGEAAEVLAALERGMRWLGEHEGEKGQAYYLYGIERTGVASGRRYFGGDDWFAGGALHALSSQTASGSIPLGYSDVIGTALSTLFLVYGGAPVAFQKLEHGADWNLNPRDLANLTRALWSAYERPLNWHTVGLDDPLEAFEAPILLISGAAALKLDDGEVKRLRGYLHKGGLILAQPSDNSPAFKASAEALAARLFGPSAPLKVIEADHPIYTVLKHDWQRRPKLRGVTEGGRALFLIADDDLSGAWQRNDVEGDAFKLAMNLLFYATDLRALEGRFTSRMPRTPAMTPKDGQRRMARIIYGSGSSWDLAAAAWEVSLAYALHATGQRWVERPPVRLTTKALQGLDLIHITGDEPLQLSAAEIKALTGYLKGGGVLLIDAFGGAAPFAEAARATLTRALSAPKPLAPDHPFTLGQFKGGVDLSTGLRMTLSARRRLRAEGRAVDAHHLEAILDEAGRPMVIFSPYDLSAARAGVALYRGEGYLPDAALQIVTHALAYLDRG
ncbi:DUF4159 domain-containing protein [Myxococcota bacterium]|nr:DUF4159 domain-containing protein [Myxococcota bacterium]MBU1898986.1 DUF4159 domain-containing protein [Myxococcota bacterium]